MAFIILMMLLSVIIFSIFYKIYFVDFPKQ